MKTDSSAKFKILYIPRAECRGNLGTLMLYIHRWGFAAGTDEIQLSSSSNLAFQEDIGIFSINRYLSTSGSFATPNCDIPGSYSMTGPECWVLLWRSEASYNHCTPY